MAVIRCAGATHTEAMVNITMSTTTGPMATRMRQNIPHLDIQNILHLDIQNIHHKQIMSSERTIDCYRSVFHVKYTNYIENNLNVSDEPQEDILRSFEFCQNNSTAVVT